MTVYIVLYRRPDGRQVVVNVYDNNDAALHYIKTSGDPDSYSILTKVVIS